MTSLRFAQLRTRAALDHLLDARARQYAQRPLAKLLLSPPLHPFVKQLLVRPFFGYRTVLSFMSQHRTKTGRELFRSLSQFHTHPPLVRGAERIPKTGGAIFVANHPAGQDAASLHSALQPYRPDAKFLILSDFTKLIPLCRDAFIPVKGLKHASSVTRQALRSIALTFAQRRSLAVFPAGGPAFISSSSHVADQPWNPGVLRIAQRFQVPIVPVHLQPKHSKIHTFLASHIKNMHQILLIRSMLKKGPPLRVTFGNPINPSHPLLSSPHKNAIKTLQSYVENDLPNDAPFQLKPA